MSRDNQRVVKITEAIVQFMALDQPLSAVDKTGFCRLVCAGAKARDSRHRVTEAA